MLLGRSSTNEQQTISHSTGRVACATGKNLLVTLVVPSRSGQVGVTGMLVGSLIEAEDWHIVLFISSKVKYAKLN